jgi:hypothetical protein
VAFTATPSSAVDLLFPHPHRQHLTHPPPTLPTLLRTRLRTRRCPPALRLQSNNQLQRTFILQLRAPSRFSSADLTTLSLLFVPTCTRMCRPPHPHLVAAANNRELEVTIAVITPRRGAHPRVHRYRQLLQRPPPWRSGPRGGGTAKVRPATNAFSEGWRDSNGAPTPVEKDISRGLGGLRDVIGFSVHPYICLGHFFSSSFFCL